jgi:hypothetical protein
VALGRTTPAVCVIGDSEGGVLTSTDPSAGAGSWQPASIDPATVDLARHIQAVACAPSGACVAGDSVGDILTAVDPHRTWSRADVDLPPGCVAAPCISEELDAGGANGPLVLDQTTPGTGASLQDIGIDNGVVSWSHDGAPRQADLG